MKNSDYLKLTHILQAFFVEFVNRPDQYANTKQLVSAAKTLTAKAVNDFEADSLKNSQYTDKLVATIKAFRAVQEDYSAINQDLFKRELWPDLDYICPPKPIGDPVFLQRLQQSDDYKTAIKKGTLSASFKWRGTISDLVRWLINSRLLQEPKPGCLETSTNRWRDADKVFIVKDKRVTAKQLSATAAQLSHRNKKTDEIQA